MFRFFNNSTDEKISYLTEIPEELMLNIFQLSPAGAQAALAQTCKTLHRLGEEPTLAINQINSAFPGRKLIHSVGDTHLILEEKHDSLHPYSLFTIRQLKALPPSAMFLSKKAAVEYAKAMKGDTLPLIQKLDGGGRTEKTNAIYLKTALGIFTANEEVDQLAELKKNEDRPLAERRGPHGRRRA